MINFNELEGKSKEKNDILKMSLSNYTAPYKIEGPDATTLNNLTEFISNNIIYKKRQNYEENDLSDIMYRYTYRYFTHFVTPEATLDLMETMLLYNRYMIMNMSEDTISNIFGIKEVFKYKVTLYTSPTLQTSPRMNSDMTFTLRIPHKIESKSNLVYNFRLPANTFDSNGRIISLSSLPLIESKYELSVLNQSQVSTSAVFPITTSNTEVGYATVSLIKNSDGTDRTYTTDKYTNNLIDNIVKDFEDMIESIYISDATYSSMFNAGFFVNGQKPDDVISMKKSLLKEELEALKSLPDLPYAIINEVMTYVQKKESSLGNQSKMMSDLLRHLRSEIKNIGMDLEEARIIFSNSINDYDPVLESKNGKFRSFIDSLSKWNITPPSVQGSTPNKYTGIVDNHMNTDRYYTVTAGGGVIETAYKNFIVDETLKNHLLVYLYKYFILMDIRVLEATSSADKDKAFNKYEVDQISESKPINYINVVHSMNRNVKNTFDRYIDIYKIKDTNNVEYPLTYQGDKKISLTYQYKELNRDIYDLFMQDQVETLVAMWLVRGGSINSLFNDIYINNFNESVWNMSRSKPVDLYTLVDRRNPRYYDKSFGMVGNTINFREKEYLDIVGYFFDTYKGTYYGLSTEHKQEIGLYLRSYQDVREYYFKNVLLKSLVNDDLYPLYEYILLVTMALDRYFTKKVSKHKDLDSYNSYDINNFLNSFGLNELNKYDNFFNSFDYKMAVIRNYNNLIKNKGTRKARGLIENMLNEASNQYDVKINEYYLTKSTKDSIQYVDKWFSPSTTDLLSGTIYKWDIDPEDETYKWLPSTISTSEKDVQDKWVDITNVNTPLMREFSEGSWISKPITKQQSAPTTPSPLEGDYWYQGTTINPEAETLVVKRYSLADSWVDLTLPTTEPPTYEWVDGFGVSHDTTGFTWFDKDRSLVIVKIMNIEENVPVVTEEYVDSIETAPQESPEEIGIIRYFPEKDKLMFVNVPEGTTRPITTIKNKINANSVTPYRDFIDDDGYWNKDIAESFISDPEGINLNFAKTKYLSISASINMETSKIMNMYIMTILDNILPKLDHQVVVDSYTDDYITLNNIEYKDLISYIKFMTKHLGSLLEPWEGNIPGHTPETIKSYYGVPPMEELVDKLATFEIKLKNIVNGMSPEETNTVFSYISSEEVNEFLYDKTKNLDNGSDPDAVKFLSMNRYKYETGIDNLKPVEGLNIGITSRKDGTLLSKEENNFANKLRKLLLGYGYSSVEFQNSAVFILDLLESTNLITIMDGETGKDHSSTKAKYLKLLAIDNISSQNVNVSNLYSVNLGSLLQILQDYTENRIFREDYTLKDSSVTNPLAINNTFIKILNLVIETFFEREEGVYNVPELDVYVDQPNTVVPETLPDFIRSFIEDLRKDQSNATDIVEKINIYNSVINSLIQVLTYMTSSNDYALLESVNTLSKNFSDADYLNFLISLLSFFMSYKVTLYEESHQLDLTNQRETLIFAEELFIWSELKLEEDWFFDEEVIDYTNSANLEMAKIEAVGQITAAYPNTNNSIEMTRLLERTIEYINEADSMEELEDTVNRQKAMIEALLASEQSST